MIAVHHARGFGAFDSTLVPSPITLTR
jgi:hypothetical protein